MKITQTGFDGLLVIHPRVFQDNRGYFFESYNQRRFEKFGITTHFVQDNESSSSFGVLRGLHYQKPPLDQAKLVRASKGKIYDVVVDLRKNSETYCKYFGIILSAANKKQLLIPRGFAHGFVVISKTAVFSYKCDNYYSAEHDAGLKYNDETFNIDWKVQQDQLIISDKDQNLPVFTGDSLFI